jgi:hypothetical protein
MGIAKNSNKSAEESPSAAEQRHKEAKKFTRDLVEELLSSTDDSVPGK